MSKACFLFSGMSWFLIVYRVRSKKPCCGYHQRFSRIDICRLNECTLSFIVPNTLVEDDTTFQRLYNGVHVLVRRVRYAWFVWCCMYMRRASKCTTCRSR